MSPIDKSLLNPTLYATLRTHWFGPLPSTALICPKSQAKKWFGVGPPSERAAFDTSCGTLFLPALNSLSPAAYPLPSSISASSPRTAANWSVEGASHATIAGPLLETLTQDGGEGYTRDAMALILLLDQMPRNIFRKEQDRIYAHYDVLARAVLHTLLSSPNRPDRHSSIRLSPTYRLWFYFPLMHSEFMEDHDRYRSLIKEFIADVENEFPSTPAPPAAGGENKSEEGKVGGEGEGVGGEEGEREIESKEAVLGEIERYRSYNEKHSVLVKKYGRYPHRNKWLGREPTKEETEYLEGGGSTFGTG